VAQGVIRAVADAVDVVDAVDAVDAVGIAMKVMS
jgi:hypothetical protein